jgi:hypothetical protein
MPERTRKRCTCGINFKIFLRSDIYAEFNNLILEKQIEKIQNTKYQKYKI